MISPELILVFRARGRMAWNALRTIRRHSGLKLGVIALFAAALWVGLYLLFMDGYHFMDGEFLSDLRADVLSSLLSVFFLSLLVLLTFSNGIISFGSLFRSDETAFLFAGPVRSADLFAYKVSESLLFSSWAFLFLALPLTVALGVAEKAPWYYYPGAAMIFGVFALIPSALGGIGALIVGRYLSRSRRRVVVVVIVMALLPAVLWLVGLARAYRLGMQRTGEPWLQNVLGRLGIARNIFLPSYWASDGILSLAGGHGADALYRLLLLLSTALFAGMAAVYLGRWLYIQAYHSAQGGSARRHVGGGAFYRVLERLIPLAGADMRLLIIKDVKTFLRDPVQWSQVLLFFGLLGVYFLNIRRFQVGILSDAFWKNLISLLNLVATSLTLSTFTTRFIFPLLSLEGKKFWILGLLPIERRHLMYSKFWFAFVGSLAISETLMAISDVMLRQPLPVIALHMLAVLFICAGLSALAVGIGALFPNLREDNPSKIVSGFGGTLNLVLSILFVVLIVALTAVPYHAVEMGRKFGIGPPGPMFILGMGMALLLTAVAVILPLWMGVAAFERMET